MSANSPAIIAKNGMNPAKTLSQNIGQIVQDYAKDVWATADTLRGAGFKESDWPKFMMPFFALALLESRAYRARAVALTSFADAGLVFNPADPQDRKDFLGEYHHASGGQALVEHDDLVYHGQGLKHITANASPAAFGATLQAYLMKFDEHTRKVLGVEYVAGQAHYLDIKNVVSQLQAKANDPLLAFCRKWATLDLAQFDSSEITTLEEHIKRRWGDISAETAGEQYTPRDLIELVASLVVSHFRKHPKKDGILRLYDPTCGGGNMLFGVEDALRRAGAEPADPLHAPDGKPYSLQTNGQELNDTLFALCSVESGFRPASRIREGNTLTHDHFAGEKFDVIVANPPYGVDWKGYKDQIEGDQSGRFDPRCRPPTSDGQQLFLQHIFSHLADDGIALVFCSGSTLFSGDAGGGESNSRSKLTLTDDGVFGVIQMPKNEFFNTGINTYLWFFWKNKPAHLKGQMFLLNAEQKFSKLRKSLGSKTSEIDLAKRQEIIARIEEIDHLAASLPFSEREGDVAFGSPTDAKLFSVEKIHYNKVNILVTRQDEEFGAISVPIKIAEATISIEGENRVTLPVATSGNTVEQTAHTLRDGGLDEIATEPPECVEEPTPAESEKSSLGDTKGVLAAIKAAVNSGSRLLVQGAGKLQFSWSSEERVLRWGAQLWCLRRNSKRLGARRLKSSFWTFRLSPIKRETLKQHLSP